MPCSSPQNSLGFNAVKAPACLQRVSADTQEQQPCIISPCQTQADQSVTGSQGSNGVTPEADICRCWMQMAVP